MSVLCVESGITYATGVAAIAAEGGANRTMQVSGSNSFATSVNSSQYSLGIVIIPNPGEETQDDGDINIGAQMTGAFSCAAPNSEIRNLRTQRLTLTSAPNITIDRLISDGTGSDAIIFNDTITASNIIIHNANDSVISSATRPNSNITNVTSVGATRFGFANGKFNDCVDINSANQGYFGEMPGSGNLWEHDGSGTNTITESPVTDIFVDFAAGKYGVLASSSPGLAGAGAFIQSAPPVGNSVSISSIMPSMTSALSVSYTIPNQSASIDSVMPGMQSSVTANYTIPGNSASIVSVMPSMTSSITVTQTVPSYNSSIFSVMPSMVSAVNISNLPPGNNSSIASVMPSMTSILSVSKDNPQYSASIDSIMPSMVSFVNLSVNNPGYNASIESIMPSMTSSLVLTTSEPVTLDLSISSTMPSMTSSLRLVNGDISEIGDITLSYVNDFISVEYTQSTITINYEE